MRNTALLFLPFALLFCAPSIGKGKKAVQLVEAFTQRVLPGIRQAPVMNVSHIIIIWQGYHSPELFTWSADSLFYKCMVHKAHKMKTGLMNVPQGMPYRFESIPMKSVNKGDTLDIELTRNPLPTPNGVLRRRPDCLYYKYGSSKWRYLPVTSFARKHDIALP